jgi:hypothetical protein
MFGISGCRIESGMTAGAVRRKKQLILINPVKPLVIQMRVVQLLGIIEKEVFKVKREQRIISPSHQGRGIID